MPHPILTDLLRKFRKRFREYFSPTANFFSDYTHFFWDLLVLLLGLELLYYYFGYPSLKQLLFWLNSLFLILLLIRYPFFWKFFRAVTILAISVFLAFWGDSFREELAERKTEKEYIKSLLLDLRRDTTFVNECIFSLRKRVLSIDSVLTYFKEHSNTSQLPLTIVRQMMDKPTWNNLFFERTGTIDQLKYSGGLRLIQDTLIVEKVQEYYYFASQHFGAVREQFRSNQDMIWQLQDKLWDDSQGIRFSSLTFDSTKTKFSFDADDSKVIRINTEYLEQNLNILLRLKMHALVDIQTLRNINMHADSVFIYTKIRYPF